MNTNDMHELLVLMDQVRDQVKMVINRSVFVAPEYEEHMRDGANSIIKIWDNMQRNLVEYECNEFKKEDAEARE